MVQFRIQRTVNHHNDEAHQRQHIREGGVLAIGNLTHEVRHDGATDNRHDHERAADFGLRTQVFHPHGKNGWEHDGHEEENGDGCIG